MITQTRGADRLALAAGAGGINYGKRNKIQVDIKFTTNEGRQERRGYQDWKAEYT